MSSTLGDDLRRKGDDESDARSDTMSEMSDYIPTSAAAFASGGGSGTNPLSVSQLMATEDIDGAPLPPSSSLGVSYERKPSRDSTGAGEVRSTSSAMKRPSSVGRSGGLSASSRLSSGGGGGAVGQRTPLGLGTSRTSASAAPTSAAGTAPGAVRRTSFGSSRSMSGGGGGGASKPSR
jgi:hypothetical protein